MGGPPDELRHRVRVAAELVFEDRDQADAEARRVLEDNAEVGDPAIEAGAARVLAIVQLHRGRPDAAATWIDQSVSAAKSADDLEVLGLAHLTRVGVNAMRGEPEAALADADRASELLDGALLTRVRVQRATVLATSLGRIDEAIADYDHIMDSPEDLDPVVEVVVRLNRGVQLLRRGDLLRCTADFRRAQLLYRQLGNQEAADEITLHLAQAAARAGDFPTVFALHSEVLERGLFTTGDPRAAIDLCDALLAAGLDREAIDMAERAATLAERADNAPAELEALVRLAEVSARREAPSKAAAAANRAVAAAHERGHEAWAARAQVIGISAGVEAHTATTEDAANLEEAIEILDRHGWSDAAVDARIQLAQIVLDLDQPSRARAVLPADRPFDHSTTAPERSRIRHARALRLLCSGDRASARRELARALRESDQVRGRSGSEELRAAASDRSADLARLGLRLAVDGGRPRAVLEWAERQRAAALRLAVAQPIHSPEHRAALDRLRSGAPLGEGEIITLERTVTHHVRARRTDGGRSRRASRASEIVRAIGPRALVEFIELDGIVDAIVVRSGRVEFRRMGVTLDTVAELINRLHFGLRRLASAVDERARSAEPVVDAAAAELNRLLLHPVLTQADEDIVIVPTRELHRVPWSALPDAAGRSVTIAPSAHFWCAASTGTPPPSSRTVVAAIAGPELPNARNEVEAVAATWPESRTLTGADAALDRAIDLLAASGIAHLVTHGRFRFDNPQFSSLLLADGPLTIHDLERLPSVPPAVVLSACSLASVDIKRTDDILGFPAALFSRGVRTLTAALLPVSDAASYPMMVDYHRRLARGAPAARALADAAAEIRHQGPSQRAAADSFMVMGYS